jgi:signal transduction histidine kinase
VLFTGQLRAEYWYRGLQLSWAAALVLSLADWEIWTLLAPLPLALAVKRPLTSTRWPRALAVHTLSSLLLAVLKLVIEARVTQVALGDRRVLLGPARLYMAVMVYWAIVGAVQFAEQRRLVVRRELQASQLQTELARARIDALRMQLHPHFLFNTLNAISGLMREDVEAADTMLTQLGDLLRTTLQNEDRQRVPLSEETDWIRTYLAIQQTRYGPRLRIDIDVPPECARALVPTLILQPVVENAICHAFAVTPGPGALSIAARIAGDRLRIDVDDEGPGVAEPLREGYGLRNTRSRLHALYGNAASLTVANRDDGHGARSRIELPVERSAA